MSLEQRRRRTLWLEYAFIAAIAIGYGYSAWFFVTYRFLPQPWFYEPWGTFMDWYSLTIWAQEGNAYDVGGTIYPPLSFVLLRLFSDGRCYPSFSYEYGRGCDPMGIVVLTAIVLINLVLTFRAYRKHDPESYIPRALAMSLGFPMIYAYERGNLLLFCYTALLLGFGPLLKSARLRWFFAGVALNFKVYLVGAVVAPLLKRRWIQTEGMLIASAVVYIVTWQLLGEGDPFQIVRNVTTYVGGTGAGGFLDLWYAGSFIPLLSILKGETFPITTILDSRTVDILLTSTTLFLRSTQLLIVVAAVAVWLRPEIVPLHRCVFLATALALSSSEAGGYTQILLLVFVFMEKWRGVGRPIALVTAYLLSIPGEYVIFSIPPMVRYSYLAGDVPVIAEYGLGAASILRLFGTYVMMIALASVTIRDVWRDIRLQGWRGRWRYRRDVPVLPFVDRPEPASSGRATSAD